MPRKANIYKPEDIQFLQDNMGIIPLRKISSHLGIPLATIHEMKTKLEKDDKMKRPPAKYLNRSHDEVLDYYLNLVV